MDDILELFIRLLDPIVMYLGPHAVAAVAVIGAIVTYISSRKQRKRERRLESKIDLLLEREGVHWSAERKSWNDTSERKSSKSFTRDITPAHLVGVFIVLMGIFQYGLRRVNIMSKSWLVGLLSYLAYFIKQITGVELPDEMINTIAEIILLLIALAAMFTNMRKGGGTDAKYPMDDGPAV